MKKLIVLLIAITTAGLIFWSCSESSTDPKPDAPVYVNEGVIGDIGGTVKIEDPSNPLNGAYVKIPEGALTSSDTIKISITEDGLRLPCDTTAVILKLEPEGLTFEVPVEIAIPFPEGSTPDNVKIYYYDPATDFIEQIPITGIDYDKGVVKGEIDHFSYYSATDEAYTLNIETIDITGKIGVRFFFDKYMKIATKSTPLGYGYANLATYYEYLYNPVIGRYEVKLYRKDLFIDNLIAQKDVAIYSQLNASDTSVKYGYVSGSTFNETFNKSVSEYALVDAVNGSKIICKFDSQINTSEKYYVKVRFAAYESWSSDDRITDIYEFSNKDKAMKIGDMPDNDEDKNNNYVKDSFDGYQPPVDYPPTCSLTSPSNNASFTQGTKISIKANASDANGIQVVNFYVDGGSLYPDSSYPYSRDVLTNDWSIGTHTIEAEAKDNNGNLSTKSKVTINITQPPNNKPTVTITSPENESTWDIGYFFVIQATATDTKAGINNVKFYIDGQEKNTDYSSPYEYTWSTKGYSAGKHTIKVRATDDQAAYTEKSIYVNLVQPNRAPVINSYSASATSVLQSGTVSLSCSASDADPGDVLTYTWTKTAGTLSSTTGTSVTWTAPTTVGTYTVTVTVSDGESSVNQSKTITVTEIPPDPFIMVSAPNGGESWTMGTAYNITWTDNIDSNVKIELFKGTTLANTISAGTESDGTFNWPIPTTLTAGTDYKVKITSTTSSAVLDESNAVFSITEEQTTNNPPVINTLISDSTSIYPSNSTVIRCSATDADPGDILTYTWTKTGGTLSSTTGTSVTWTAPTTIGTCTITCTVSDGNGGVAVKTVNIYVTDGTSPSGMVLVQGGTFQIGDEVGDLWYGCSPVHQVTLNSFYIGATEVTQFEWAQYMPPAYEQVGGTSYGYGAGDTYPVYYTSWYSIIKYCNLRSIAEGLTPCYKISSSTNPADWGEVPTDYDTAWDAIECDWTVNGYRLPTDAEFEYAARGGIHYTDGYLYSGSNDVNSVAWYDGNNDPYGSKPVGTKAPNQLGIYDMSGNVWEWCWDWYSSYTSDSVTNPTGPTTGSYRVGRGGGWYGTAAGCRVANRSDGDPYISHYHYSGFRLSRTP